MIMMKMVKDLFAMIESSLEYQRIGITSISLICNTYKPNARFVCDYNGL